MPSVTPRLNDPDQRALGWEVIRAGAGPDAQPCPLPKAAGSAPRGNHRQSQPAIAGSNRCLHAAGAWFLQSGIQNSSGGVARYLRTDDGEHARVSTEITGYTVNALLFCYERTGEHAYLDHALRAARFLTRTAWDPFLKVFPFECGVYGQERWNQGPLAYFFDTGIIVRSLLSAWRVTNDREFLDVAIAAGRGMLTDFRDGEVIRPIVSLPEKLPVPYQPRWSANPGCYQLKGALAWRELFDATGEARFLRAYESVVENALATEDRFLPGHPNREKVMDQLHPYAYFLEGLLPVLDRLECARVFEKGLLRMSEYLWEIAPVFARSDVYAQLLRLRLYGERLAGVRLDFAAAIHEAHQAASFQATSQDPRVAGGFWFGHKRGETLPFVNPVSTAFCVQALVLWEERKKGDFDSPSITLI